MPEGSVSVLSIDGGGVRGIIPALVLAELEKRLPVGSRIAECFDVIAGTSAGGILALALSLKGEEGCPKHTAESIAIFYQEMSEKIFSRTCWYVLKHLDNLLGPRYSSKIFEKILRQYFGDAKLKDAFTDVIIPAYDIQNDHPYFFKSRKGKKWDSHDFYIRDIARATSAAPTYFSPAYIQNIQRENYTFIDGGMVVNNPTLSGYIHAKNLYGANQNYTVLSLGTGDTFKGLPYAQIKNGGALGWARRLVPIILEGTTAVTDYQMQRLFFHLHEPDTYWRFEVVIDKSRKALDDALAQNFLYLKECAKKLIAQNDHELDVIAAKLTERLFLKKEASVMLKKSAISGY